MPVSCCAPNCNNVPKKSHRGFYKFPFDNKELLKKWINAIDRPNWVPTRESVICSDHFLKHHFKKIKNRRHLEEFAVPTFFTSAPSEKSVNSPGSFVNKDIQNLAPVVPEIERQRRNSSAADVEDLSSFSRSYCRLCSCKGDNLISIFGEEGELFDVIEKMGRCIPMIVLPNDDLPTSICYQCLTKLNTCFLFIDSALKAETTLKKKLDKIKIQAQTNPDASFMETDSVGIKEEVARLPTSDSTEDRRGNEKDFACSERRLEVLSGHKEKGMTENSLQAVNETEPRTKQQIIYSSALKLKGPIKCDVCDIYFANMNYFNEHTRRHEAKGMYACQFCYMSYDTPKGLIMHKTEMHCKNLICCGNCRSEKMKMRRRDPQSANCQYECELCGDVFVSAGQLTCHYSAHLFKILCNSCNRKFPSLTLYKHHRATFGCRVGRKKLNKGNEIAQEGNTGSTKK